MRVRWRFDDTHRSKCMRMHTHTMGYYIPVYMPKDLKEQVEARADDREQSMSGYFKTLARRDLQREELES